MKDILKTFKYLRFQNILQQKEFAQAEQELDILEHDLDAAKTFIQEHKKSFFKRKKVAPRYLVIGSSRSGKTTLLSQSGLGLVDINLQPLNNVAPTKNCSWWFTPQGIYLDTAGIYTKPEIERPRDELVWTGFIKALKKKFGKNPLSGVIIALDLPAISQDKALLQQTLFYVRDRIYEISRFATKLPIYIVFTKCDLISGFTTFFEHLDLDQRKQVFGMDFSAEKKSFAPAQQFNQKFDLLLQKLEKQLLPRLQQARKPEHCMLLHNFPLQLESLRPLIAEVLNKIPFGANIQLRGIFFTSSIQEGKQIDYLQSPLQNIVTLTTATPNISEPQSNHSYFTIDLFNKLITQPEKKFNRAQIKTWLSYGVIISFAAISVIASSYYWLRSYQENAAAIQLTKTALQTPTELNDFDKLKQLTTQLDQREHSIWLKLGINRVHALNNSIKKIYQTVTANTYIFQAQQFIEAELTAANNSSAPRQIYDDLRTYLMLSDPQKIDTQLLKQWFHTYAITKFPNDLERQLKIKEAVEVILTHNIKIKADPKVIAQALQTLKNMSKNQLLFILLENKFKNKTFTLKSDKASEVFVNVSLDIPEIYTAENFSKIYNQEIPNIVNTLKFSDSVLGDSFTLPIDKAEKSKLITDLQDQYLDNYALAWEQLLKTIKWNEAKDISHLAQQLTILADNDSPLLQLLKLIKENSAFKDAPAKLTQLIETKLAHINTIDFAALQSNLTTLANYFGTISKSPDTNKAAFAATSSRFQDSSKHDPLTLLQSYALQQPKPIQTWLLTLTANGWNALLDTTRTYIANQWKENIAPQFQKLATNKYPIFKNGTSDLSLRDFNKLFGPNGLLDGFFTIYIKPFVDTDQMYWVWKDVDGQKLNFSQNSLEVFIRAALIQKMYYTNGGIAPSARFTLTPIDMTANTQSFTLNLEGQMISYKKGLNKVDQLVWPGPTPGKVSIEFVNKDGKHFTTTQTGPWAWFKLLEKTNMQTINNSQHFELTFDLNGNAVKYELITAEAVSPFIPQIISDFRCPDSL